MKKSSLHPFLPVILSFFNPLFSQHNFPFSLRVTPALHPAISDATHHRIWCTKYILMFSLAFFFLLLLPYTFISRVHHSYLDITHHFFFFTFSRKFRSILLFSLILVLYLPLLFPYLCLLSYCLTSWSRL